MTTILGVLILVSPIVFTIYAIKAYKLYKKGEKLHGAKAITFVVSGILTFILIAMMCDTSDDSTVVDNNNSTTTTEEQKEITSEPTNSFTGSIEWKGHTLKSDIYIAYNDDYAITIDSIQKVQDCIQFKYTFYNESDDTMCALWVLNSVPYQNGINLNDNEEYSNSYYECFNEQTTIMSGYSIDNCSELIPIGDGSEITIELGCGMWNDTHIMTINPETLDYTIKEK